jgi:hypothetical protein
MEVYLNAVLFRLILSRTTITIQNMYTPLCTANINAYFQDTCLPGCFAGG